jgi:hypothetical protein
VSKGPANVNIPSATKRVPLDIDTTAIESLEWNLVEIFNWRQPKAPVKFHTTLTQFDDDEATKHVQMQHKTSDVFPLFIIRRTNMQLAADYLNPYVTQKYGVTIGHSKDMHHAITVFPTKVIYSMNITLMTQDFNVMDHWIRVLMAYCRQEIILGEVVLGDPVYSFQTRVKFTENYDYPPLIKGDNFTGFTHNVSVDLSTYICDLEFVPTIGEIIFDPVVSGDATYRQNDKQFLLDAAQKDPLDTLPATVYSPSLRFTVTKKPEVNRSEPNNIPQGHMR